MKSKLEETNTVLTNFKMYKSGKQWLFASVAAIAMLAATGAATTVHADTTTPAQPQTTQQTSQSQPATKENTTTLSTSNASQGNGGNVSGNSLSAELYSSNGGSNQTVQTYPHKDQIDNAVKSVQNTPHLTVHQDPDQVVTGNSQEEIDQKIQNDYNQQVQDLKKQKDQAILSNQEHANYKKYNETHGDTSALDQTVKDANNTPGLTVVKDNDTNSNFSSDDTNGLRNWVTNTQTDYQHQVEQMKQAIAAQKQKNQTYDTQMAQYQKAKEAFDKTINGLPTIVENGNTKLVGSTGKAGSLDYYKGVRVVSTQQGTVALDSIGWNSDSQLIGANGKASLNDYQGKLADGKLENFYDITNVIRNNGTITLTNAAVDSYGNKYDLQLSFANTERAKQAYNNPNLPTKVIIGPADDGSIEFDFYGGIEVGGGSINITNLKFLYHGTSTPVNNVTFGTMFSDLDQGQHFTTDMGNVLTYTPNNSEVQISGGEYTSTNLDRDDHGFKSTPLGTGIMVANGNNFHFQFWNADDKHGGSIEKPANSNDKFDVGTQFNIFGKGTTLAQSPTPPFRRTTQTRYHYDTAKVTPPINPESVNAKYHYDVVDYTPGTQKHFTNGAQIADHQVFSDGSVATATITATLPVASEVKNGLKSVTATEDYSNYAKYVGKGSYKVKEGNNDVTNQWAISDNGNGQVTFTLKNPATANGQTVTFLPTWTINKDVPNGTKFVNKANLTVNDVPGTPSTTDITVFTPTPSKDVEMGGDVQGDTPASINGQVVAAGSEVTYPLSDKTGLPANRAQQVTSHVITETLDNALQYVGYKAYLPGANNQLQDVTNHVLLTKNGQNLTFTDDSYLLGLYNKDLKSAFKLPIIDLVAKANSDTKIIPNKFNSTFTYKDDNGTNTVTDTSNTVNISTFTPTATKDVELGDDVQGDTQNSIAGSLVEAGTVVTWPLRVSNLPANRAQDLTSHAINDTLDSNLTFDSYKAYLPQTDGTLKDVTEHVHLTKDGQKLTFKDDDTLLKQYNADKKQSQALPIIDLVTKVNGESKLIPNTFQAQNVFKDGKGNTSLQTTSNKVSIKTATAPTPVKSDLSSKDNSQINGQKVNNGDTINYAMTWDLSNDKGVQTTPDMIKKGFFFADPVDPTALTVGDLSRAEVYDQQDHKVDGITFHAYDKVSDAPEFIQEQIKDNHLLGAFNGKKIVIAQATDPQSFFTKYVQTGSKLRVVLPVTVNKNFKGSFANTAYQFGFGKATPTNTVTNYVNPEKPTPKTPTPTPTKTPTPTPAPKTSAPAPTPVSTPTPAPAPVQPAPAQPQVATPAPASASAPAQQPQQQMPQTGNAKDNLAVLGLAAAAMAGTLSYAALGVRKKQN